MTRREPGLDLFAGDRLRQPLSAGALLLGGFALPDAAELLHEISRIAGEAPFRHMVTPGGWPMSVGMTNCGRAGWVTDRAGYRYDRIDPATDRPWPPMPGLFADLARNAAAVAGFDGFSPDACLVNRYAPGARLTLHQDRNERDFDAPIVSVSLGLPATFLWGGRKRSDRPTRMRLFHGDVLVWGGPARLTFHGVDALASGDSPAGEVRYNLTFRKAL